VGERVVVTGGARFLGSRLCERLVSDGDEPWIPAAGSLAWTVDWFRRRHPALSPQAQLADLCTVS
jgi:nucleoside-diphosphate-sugar epimerase